MIGEPVEPKQPQDLHLTADDSLSSSDDVTRHVIANRTAADRVRLADKAQARVAQAQAQIAEAVGQARDATTRIEELSAVATTPEEQEVVVLFRTINQKQVALGDDMLEALTALRDGVDGLRTDQQQSGKIATRWNVLFLLIAIVSVVVAIIAVLRP
jgi:hypothetical protein